MIYHAVNQLDPAGGVSRARGEAHFVLELLVLVFFFRKVLNFNFAQIFSHKLNQQLIKLVLVRGEPLTDVQQQLVRAAEKCLDTEVLVRLREYSVFKRWVVILFEQCAFVFKVRFLLHQ